MYQIFSSLQGHLHFSVHFFFTFMANFFVTTPYQITSLHRTRFFLSLAFHSLLLPLRLLQIFYYNCFGWVLHILAAFVILFFAVTSPLAAAGERATTAASKPRASENNNIREERNPEKASSSSEKLITMNATARLKNE